MGWGVIMWQVGKGSEKLGLLKVGESREVVI